MDRPITIIRPPQGLMSIGLAEIWRYRELFGFMVWRDITVRYKQTLLGFGWAVLVPLISAFVFATIFGRLGKLPADGLPPMLFYMGGLIIWRYFQASLNNCGNCLVSNQALLTKIYVPRLIIPAAALLAGLVDLALAMLVMLVLMLCYGVVPAVTTLLLPVLVLVTFGTALGVGLFFSALNVKYRDVRQLLPFVGQLWMYCTVIFPFSRMPEWLGNWKYLYGLNPLAGVVEGFRWCLMHPRMTTDVWTAQLMPGRTIPERLAENQEVVLKVLDDGTMALVLRELTKVPVEPPLALLALGLPVMLLLLAGGLYYFRRVEKNFADIV